MNKLLQILTLTLFFALLPELLISQDIEIRSFYRYFYDKPFELPYSSHGEIAVRFKGLKNYAVINIFARKSPEDTTAGWLVYNALQPASAIDEDVVYRIDLKKIGINNNDPLNRIYLCPVISDTFLFSPPDFSGKTWKEYVVDFNRQNLTNAFIELPEISFGDYTAESATFSRIDTAEINDTLPDVMRYTGSIYPDIDLDDNLYPPGIVPGYAGDLSASAIAAAANAFQYLDQTFPQIQTGRSLREKQYEISSYINRQDNKGIKAGDLISAILRFTDSVKIPVRTEFQSDYLVNNIASPINKYHHYAVNVNLNGSGHSQAHLSWDFLYDKVMQGSAAILTLEYFLVNDAGIKTPFGSHAVVVSGIADIYGKRQLWLKHDTRQNAGGGTQQLMVSWTENDSGDIFIPEMSGLEFNGSGTIICKVTGIITLGYDPRVRHDLTDLRLERYDFKSPFIENLSTTCRFCPVAVDGDEIKYLNVFVRSPDPQLKQGFMWITRNIPILPDKNDRLLNINMPLNMLDIEIGQELDSLEIAVINSKAPFIIEPDTLDSLLWEKLPVGIIRYIIGDESAPYQAEEFQGFLNLNFRADGLPAVSYFLDGIPNLDLDSTTGSKDQWQGGLQAAASNVISCISRPECKWENYFS